MSGPTIWSVIDSDNFECGGIHSLHWSLEGAVQESLDLVAKEDLVCLAATGKRMALIGPREWAWTHRTICVEVAKVRP